jgi:hypothetical protein
MEDKELIEFIEQQDHVTFDSKITWGNNEITLNFIDFKKGELTTYNIKKSIQELED